MELSQGMRRVKLFAGISSLLRIYRNLRGMLLALRSMQWALILKLSLSECHLMGIVVLLSLYFLNRIAQRHTRLLRSLLLLWLFLLFFLRNLSLISSEVWLFGSTKGIGSFSIGLLMLLKVKFIKFRDLFCFDVLFLAVDSFIRICGAIHNHFIDLLRPLLILFNRLVKGKELFQISSVLKVALLHSL